MNLLSSNIFRAAAVACALPLLGVSATVTITPATLTYANGASEAGSSATTVAGPFSVDSTYKFGVTSTGSTYVNFYPTVTYTGSTPLAAATTVNVDLLANIYDSAISTFDGVYSEHIPFLVAAGGSASGQLLVDGQSVGVISGGPGYSDGRKSLTLSGISGGPLSYAFDLSFTFAKGTLTGASSSSSAPEPATMIPAALGLAGFALVAIRRRKS